MTINKSITILVPMLLGCICTVSAQDDYEQYSKQKEQEFADFKQQRESDFEAFRRKVNNDYAAFVERTWREFNAFAGRPIPKEEPVPPVIHKDKKEKQEDKQLPIAEVVPPEPPKPQPAPITPIKQKPTPIVQYMPFTFFGTSAKIEKPEKGSKLKLQYVSELNVAEGWKKLSDGSYDNMLNGCLELRRKHYLCDWSYLQMLQTISEQYCGKGNEANLLCAWLYCQSGYKMRLANDNGKLIMLYASKHDMYNIPFWTIDGDHYYPLSKNVSKSIYICQVGFPKEQQLSLNVTQEQQFTLLPTQERTFQSKRYSDVVVKAATNRNLIDFFNTYPTSCINQDFGTRWAMYANTPMSKEAISRLYPSLRRHLQGKTQLESVNRILNLLQTALVYEYDDKVWGHDRAFFPDETLYYPYCDCEDRSILLSRLVRDILGLKVVLIYYPGHLASAVHFTQPGVKGDYVMVQGQKYIICDPTYIGAPVGVTMDKMDNSKAKIILLE